MKPFFIFLAFFFAFESTIQAQSIEFAPEGAVWTYSRREGFWGPPMFSIVQVTYNQDVVVNSIVCKEFLAAEGNYLIYQSGDKVFNSWDYGNTFHLLWDFGVMPGDTFTVPMRDSWQQMYGNTSYVCTGRDTAMVNGELLPRIYLNNLCSSSAGKLVVNPRFGPMYIPDQGCPEYVLPSWPGCLTDQASSVLLSYQDNVFPPVTGCPTIEDEPVPVYVIASPNPTSGQFTLTNLPENARVRVFDCFGRAVALPTNASNLLDLSNNPNGVYLVDIQVDNVKNHRIKVVKI